MYLKRKYQVGGIAYTPYLAAQAGSTQETSGSSSSSSSSPEKISGTIKGEIVNLLKENGLPSDVSMFLSAAKRFLSNSTNLSSFSTFGGKTGGDYDLSDLIKIQQLVNDVKYNNNLRNKAVEQLTKEAAGSEVALTNTGYMYVKNSEGNLEKITPKQYVENKDDYAPITNDELLYLREHDNGLAFETGILNDIQNTIGMKTIVDYLRDTITKFGSDKVGGYTTKNDSVNKGLKLLTEAGPDGFYKFTTKDQVKDVNNALRYLYNSLSENAKNLIRAKTAVEGGDPNDSGNIANLLYQALYHHTSSEKEVNFDSTATKSIGSGSGSSSDDPKNLREYTYVERLAAGQNSGIPEQLRITNRNLPIDMVIAAFNVGNIVKDKDENSIGSGMLDTIRQDAYGLNQVATQGTVQFGDQEFNKNNQSTIFYDGSTMYRTKMPSTRNDNGDIVVDWNAVNLLESIKEQLQNTSYTPDMLERLLKETDPRLYLDENGQISWTDTSWFLTFDGIVANNYENNLNTDSPWIEKLAPFEEGRYREKYENALKYGYSNPDKNAKERIGHNKKEGTFIINWRTHDLYKSKVFMPITRQMAGSSEFYPAATHMDNFNTAMNAERANQIKREMNLGSRKTNFD